MLLNCGVGEDSWESFDCKEIQLVNPKGNQPWIFVERTDVEAETPILWPSDVNDWLIWKDPDAGKDWRQEKGTTEDEMVGWHHQLDGHEFFFWHCFDRDLFIYLFIFVVNFVVHWNETDGHEFEQALVVGDGQGSLMCCSPCGHKEVDTTEWLNWTEHLKMVNKVNFMLCVVYHNKKE